MGLLPAIDGPPVWIVTVMPCALAHRTIGAASLPVFTEPRPISPTSRTPAAAISAKSCSVMPSSRIGAPACTLTPPGRKLAQAFAATMASALSPTMSFGRPGRCTSPAEMAVVTPPCIPESMKSTVRCRGVKSPNTGCTCESISPGITVVPRASMTVSASPSRPRPIAAILPSRITTESASRSGRPISPLTSMPMLCTRVITRGPRRASVSNRETRCKSLAAPDLLRCHAVGDLMSIIIPCYNQAHYLGDAIASARSQTYPFVEVIVVDDGSTDDTAAVVARHAPVRYLRQPNRGLPAARNAGWQASKGRYVIFLDADDRLLPNAVNVGVTVLAARPDAALAVGLERRIAADGSPLPTPRRARVDTDYYASLVRRCWIVVA